MNNYSTTGSSLDTHTTGPALNTTRTNPLNAHATGTAHNQSAAPTNTTTGNTASGEEGFKASKAAGWKDEAVGGIKETTGKALRKPEMEAQGEAQKLKGKAEVEAAKATKGKDKLGKDKDKNKLEKEKNKEQAKLEKEQNKLDKKHNKHLDKTGLHDDNLGGKHDHAAGIGFPGKEWQNKCGNQACGINNQCVHCQGACSSQNCTYSECKNYSGAKAGSLGAQNQGAMGGMEHSAGSIPVAAPVGVAAIPVASAPIAGECQCTGADCKNTSCVCKGQGFNKVGQPGMNAMGSQCAGSNCTNASCGCKTSKFDHLQTGNFDRDKLGTQDKFGSTQDRFGNTQDKFGSAPGQFGTTQDKTGTTQANKFGHSTHLANE